MPYDPPTYSDTEAVSIEKSRANEVLDRAKRLHAKKRYELRIDERTTILVEKKNFNRAYAEAYRAKIQMNALHLHKDTSSQKTQMTKNSYAE